MSSDSTGGVPARILEAWTRLMERWRTQPGAEKIAETAIAGAPVVWLVGRVQAGKSSIIQALTGCDEAEIGNGFKACSRAVCASKGWSFHREFSRP
jgi:ribosome-interacting GTPase 1